MFSHFQDASSKKSKSMRGSRVALAVLLLCVLVPNSVCWLPDPFSAAVTIASGLAMKYFMPDLTFTKVKSGLTSAADSVRCVATDKLGECCRAPWINVDVRKLDDHLRKVLFGQHVVHDVLVKTLRARSLRQHPSKALVLSFHGGTGVGKNWVASRLAYSMYKNGMRSKFVHLFLGTLHFPHQDRIEEYKETLQKFIKEKVRECGESMFIFDEIDKAPDGLFDALKPFIDFHESVDGVDYRRATFVFLSNTGGEAINDKMLSIWKSGRNREEATYDDFEDLVARGAFNEKGGLHYSVVIQKVLVDHFVPFLPLEKRHLRQCAEFYAQYIKRRSLSDEQMESVLARMVYKPKDEQLFSAMGCKRISQSVDLVLEDDMA